MKGTITQSLLRWNGLLLPAGGGILLAAIVGFFGEHWWSSLPERIARADTTSFLQEPVLVGTVDLPDRGAAGAPPPSPYALSFSNGELLVARLNAGAVDIFDENFRWLGARSYGHGGALSSITGIAADGERVYVADWANGEVRIHRKDGSLINAFSWLPGKAGRLSPLGLNLYKGVLYVADPGQHRLLAIAASTAGGVIEEGELLFAAPSRSAGGDTAVLSAPVSDAVTKDGRILVSDRQLHRVSVYTCNGRFAEQFTTPVGIHLQSPSGIGIDNLPSPDLLAQDATSFDPSGVRHQGRIHVVDAALGEVLVFDALGEYVLRYGKGTLQSPNGIAIDQGRRIIVIANTGGGNLIVYRY